MMKKRNVWDIIGCIGVDVVSEFVPGGVKALKLINTLLPPNRQLGSNATGGEIRKAANELPESKQNELKLREIDIEEAQLEVVSTMLKAEADSQHSTRPYIAKVCVNTLAFISILAVLGWTMAMYNQFQGVDKDSILQAAAMAKSIEDGWPFILSIVGPFVTLLSSYFGILRKESNDNLNELNGHKIELGGLSNLWGNLKNKGLLQK